METCVAYLTEPPCGMAYVAARVQSRLDNPLVELAPKAKKALGDNSTSDRWLSASGFSAQRATPVDMAALSTPANEMSYVMSSPTQQTSGLVHLPAPRQHDEVRPPAHTNTGCWARSTPGPLAVAQASYCQLFDKIDRFAPRVLRVSLALVFLWFGVLKLTGDSPVLALVSATVPWVNSYLLMHLLGAVEVLLAVGLLLGRAQRFLLLILAAHLSGTFLTFFMAPQLMIQHGKPLLLTADGEFVLKNLVLISATLLLAARAQPASWSTRVVQVRPTVGG